MVYVILRFGMCGKSLSCTFYPFSNLCGQLVETKICHVSENGLFFKCKLTLKKTLCNAIVANKLQRLNGICICYCVS